MLIIRLLIVLIALLLVMSGGMYLVSRDRRYLDFAWRTVRFSVLLAAVFAVLYVLERYVLTGWRILL